MVLIPDKTIYGRKYKVAGQDLFAGIA
jgi:hypothetical protein